LRERHPCTERNCIEGTSFVRSSVATGLDSVKKTRGLKRASSEEGMVYCFGQWGNGKEEKKRETARRGEGKKTECQDTIGTL